LQPTPNLQFLPIDCGHEVARWQILPEHDGYASARGNDVQRLSYIGLNVANIAAWRDFATQALGLMVGETADGVVLRLDSRACRLILQNGSNDDVAYVGIECDNAEEADAVGQRLIAGGIRCTALDVAECARRHVGGGFWLTDPDALRIEIIWGAACAKTEFKSDLGVEFVTGDGGLGHVVLSASDAGKSIAFYEKLGFKISDFINAQMAPGFTLRIAFMHCNPRHHSLAIAQLPGPKRLNHIMIEANHVDDVMKAHRRCIDLGLMPGQIGRHTNDEMFSFYVPSPAGFDIEFGWGGVEIVDEWTVREYNKISLWGHERA
jgi:2,3-dihydroxybiphenyl 1,2-dioxygenase